MRLRDGTPLRWEWRAAAIALVVALVTAVVSATQLYLNWSRFEDDVSFAGLLLAKLVDWLLWVAAAPLIVVLDRRAGFQARRWPGALLVHLAAAVSWFLLHNGALVLLSVRMGVEEAAGVQAFARLYADRILFKLPGSLLVYGFILGIFWIIHLLDRRHKEEMRRVQLEAELSEVQLRGLKMQLQPHFLFNTMNTIAGLIREGERAEAVEVMSEFCDLLRRSLQELEVQEVPLEDELDFLRRYLRIQHIRFGDRLHSEIRVDDEVRAALVPSLLLQPLLENAMGHGLDLATEPGRVCVRARRDGDHLVLEVTDNGQGIADVSVPEGIGLGNTRRRLAHLYGGRQQLAILPVRPRGTIVRIRIPLRREASAAGRPSPQHLLSNV